MGCAGSKGSESDDAGAQRNHSDIQISGGGVNDYDLPPGTPIPEAVLRNALWPDIPMPKEVDSDKVSRSTNLERINESKIPRPNVEITENSADGKIIESDGHPVFVEILTIEISELPLEGDSGVESDSSDKPSSTGKEEKVHVVEIDKEESANNDGDEKKSNEETNK